MNNKEYSFLMEMPMKFIKNGKVGEISRKALRKKGNPIAMILDDPVKITAYNAKVEKRAKDALKKAKH